MRMIYDREVDALAIDLVADGRSARMVRLTDFVRADLDQEGRLLSIEILDASAFYPEAELAALGTSEEWVSLAVAAKESGLERDTLRQLIHADRLHGKKDGRDWKVTTRDLFNYLESRAPVGRPAKKRKARRKLAAAG